MRRKVPTTSKSTTIALTYTKLKKLQLSIKMHTGCLQRSGVPLDLDRTLTQSSTPEPGLGTIVLKLKLFMNSCSIGWTLLTDGLYVVSSSTRIELLRIKS